MKVISYEKISALNDVYGIWQFDRQVRVTYVARGWLIVWDHRASPPIRYDCKGSDHRQACDMAEGKVRELLSASTT